jgi:hypothetical protein
MLSVQFMKISSSASKSSFPVTSRMYERRRQPNRSLGDPRTPQEKKAEHSPLQGDMHGREAEAEAEAEAEGLLDGHGGDAAGGVAAVAAVAGAEAW